MRCVLLILVVILLAFASCSETRRAEDHSAAAGGHAIPDDGSDTTPVPVEHAPDVPDHVIAADEPAQVITQVPPVYPETAEAMGLEGVVLLQIVVNELGEVAEATVVQGIDELNQAAIEAVHKWKFQPAKQRGVPVPVRMVVPVRFTLGE